MEQSTLKTIDSSKFVVYLKGRDTQVECDFFGEIDSLQSDNTESGELRSHGVKDCDCIWILHSPFRLKMMRVQRDKLKYRELDIYISGEPSDEFHPKCVVSTDSATSYPLQSSYQSPDAYTGWTYITTLPYTSGVRLLSLNLYKNRALKRKYRADQTSRLCLTDYMSQLLMDGTYSDLTVTSDNGTAIKVHRGILAKRSEVFLAAFKHNDTGGAVTTPFNEETLRQILTYMYTDMTPNTEYFSADLFMAADFYHLLDLKNFCIAAFFSQLNVENAIATLELAERHSLTDLMNFTLNFVKMNIEAVKNTEDWINLKSAGLLKKLFELQPSKGILLPSFE